MHRLWRIALCLTQLSTAYTSNLIHLKADLDPPSGALSSNLKPLRTDADITRRGRFSCASVPLHQLYPDGNAKIRRTWETKRKQLIAITGARDFSYYANVNVGGQPFNVALDTGSADLWIQSQNCSTNNCIGAAQYLASSSLIKSNLPFTLNYLSGQVSGQISTDTVRLAQYEVLYQVFALADNLKNMTFAQIGVSGMLGLSFPAVAAISSTLGLPIIFSIAAYLDVTQQFFAFRLGRDVGTSLGNSSFNIGQHDPIVTDPAALQYIPVFPKSLAANVYDFWKIPLDGIIVNGDSIQLAKSKISSSKTPLAVFDTGTSLILGPTVDVDAIYNSIQGGNPNKNEAGQWTIDCLLAISLLLIIGGRPYPIHPLDLAWDKISDDHGRCFGGIQGNDDVISGDYLFGDTAMRNIYTAHYFEITHSPPLLALLGTTKPSASLREFIDARGSGFILSPGSTFSDDVLGKTYTSAYAQALALQHTDFENFTFGNTPLPYYDTKKSAGNAVIRNFILVLLIPAAAGATGFLIGTIIAVLAGRRNRRFSLQFTGRDLDAIDANMGPLLNKGASSLTRMEGRRVRGQLTKTQRPGW